MPEESFPPHCELDHVLTLEEMARLQELFRQHGIQINETDLIAKIKKTSPIEHCPFRYHLGPNFQFCSSECAIKKIFNQN